MKIKIEKLINLSEEKAMDLITAAGLRYRIVRRDSDSLPNPEHSIVDRVNLEIEQGKVVRVYVG